MSLTSPLRKTSLRAGVVAMMIGSICSAQTPATPEPAVYVHAGSLLDKPGQPLRGAATIIVRGGKIEAVRDGLVAPEAGAKLVDPSARAAGG